VDIALRAGLVDHPEPVPPVIEYLFSAVVITAIVTTVASPVLLRALLRQAPGGGDSVQATSRGGGMRLLTMGAALGAAMAGLPGCRSIPVGETWRVDNLAALGGYPVTVRGDPRVIDTPAGPAIEFDGVDDAIFLATHPLEGMSEFTVEIVFRPAADGAREQRSALAATKSTGSKAQFARCGSRPGRWIRPPFCG
jgi:hypothetical protein